MPAAEITKLRDQDAWIVQTPDGAVGFSICLTGRPNWIGGAAETLQISISGRFGEMNAAFLSLGKDWRSLIQLTDAPYFFGKALGHEAWVVNEVQLHRNLSVQIGDRIADPAAADRVRAQIPETIARILQGREDIPAEVADVLPEEWDETLVPRKLRPDLGELWADYWRPFKAQMKAEMLAGIAEPGRAVAADADVAAVPIDDAEVEEETAGMAF